MPDFHDITKDKKEKYSLTKPGTHVFFLKNRSGEITFSLEHEKAHLFVFALFEGSGKQRFSLKTVQHHEAPGARSSLLVKTILDEGAHFSFEGRIHINRLAQKTEAHLENRNLVLSKDAHVDTEPILEILPDDVVCTHAATTAPLNEDSLHFLSSRGLSKTSSKKIITDGFRDDLFQKLEKAKKI